MASSRPHVLFLLTGPWRGQAFGFAGDVNASTPALDALAAQSIRFTHAVANCPATTPAECTLLTGQYPLKHGCLVDDSPLITPAGSLATLLREAGYRVDMLGPWRTEPRGSQGHEPMDAVTQAAIARLRSASAGEAPAAVFVRLTAGEPGAAEVGRPSDVQVRANVPAASVKEAQAALAGFYARAAAVDAAVQRLLDTLDATGLAADTLVVFTSVHGQMLMSHRLTGSQWPFEESIRVPLMLRWPRKFHPRASVIDAPIGHVDLLPTLLDLLELPCPAGVQGDSFAGFLRGESAPPHGESLIACYCPFGEVDKRAGGREYRGLRTGSHTYVRTLTGPWMLFDNQQDPLQQINLVDDPAASRVRRELDHRLDALLRRMGDDFRAGEVYLSRQGISSRL